MGLQTTTTEADLVHLINITAMRAVVCSAKTLPLLCAVTHKCPSLRLLICTEVDAAADQPALHVAAAAAGCVVLSCTAVEARGAAASALPLVCDEAAPLVPIFTLIFTSGSTGVPKVVTPF